MQNSNSNRGILWGIVIAILVVAAAGALFFFRNEIIHLFVPAPPCGQSQLEINSQSYRIETIQPDKDGAISVPGNQPGTAYWVEDTTSNYVFYINENLSVTGGAAKITWANCNSTAYVLYELEQGMPDNATLLDQSTSGITIIVQNTAIIKGSLIGEEINAFNTPNPADILAEISLLETTLPEGGTTLRVGVSILNAGQSNITLTTRDVALRVGLTDLAPLNSEPALPKQIAVGATETFYFTFNRPNAPGATLKVFSVEYELEGY